MKGWGRVRGGIGYKRGFEMEVSSGGGKEGEFRLKGRDTMVKAIGKSPITTNPLREMKPYQNTRKMVNYSSTDGRKQRN